MKNKLLNKTKNSIMSIEAFSWNRLRNSEYYSVKHQIWPHQRDSVWSDVENVLGWELREFILDSFWIRTHE